MSGVKEKEEEGMELDKRPKYGINGKKNYYRGLQSSIFDKEMTRQRNSMNGIHSMEEDFSSKRSWVEREGEQRRQDREGESKWKEIQ